MTFLKNLLAALAVLGIFAMAAWTQTVPTSQEPVPPAAQVPPQSPAAPTSAGAVIIKYKVEMLDKDRDGLVSRAEAAAVPELLKVFDKLDRNRDGKLDERELDAYTK